MLKRVFLVAAAGVLAAFAIAGCGGGGQITGDVVSDPTIAGQDEIFGIDKNGEPIVLGKNPSDVDKGSYYHDPEADEFDFDHGSYNDFDWGDADNPVDWPYDWGRNRWGGYADSSCDEWSLIFDYGSDSEGDGNNHYWVDAEIVEGDFGQGDGYYMCFEIVNTPYNAPDGANAGYPDDGMQSFYGFADAAVHFSLTEGDFPRTAGKFHFGEDLTSPDTDPAGKVPLDALGDVDDVIYVLLEKEASKKNPAVSYENDFMGEDYFIAIHATVAFFVWVDEYVDGGGNTVPAHYEYQTPKMDDTGWGICPPEKKSSDYVLFEAFDDRSVAGDHNYSDAYWEVDFTVDGNYPWLLPQSNSFNGWCTDPTGFVNGLRNWVVSCYDPVLDGTYSDSDHYDLISWILNEVNHGDGSEVWHRASANFDRRVVQRAVWYFKFGLAGMADGDAGAGNGNVTYDNNQAVRDLVQAAKDNGENYTPGPGEYFAALLIPVDTRVENPAGTPNPNYGGYWFGKSQVNIIEVDP